MLTSASDVLSNVWPFAVGGAGLAAAAVLGTLLPGLQQSVFSAAGGAGYGITTEGGVYVAAPEVQLPSSSIVYRQPAYTSVEGMKRADGSIGTVQIPSLNISLKVWEGETNASMSKGLGHYSSTSAWDGNVGVCGHNRGSKYVIGAIKDMEDCISGAEAPRLRRFHRKERCEGDRLCGHPP